MSRPHEVLGFPEQPRYSYVSRMQRYYIVDDWTQLKILDAYLLWISPSSASSRRWSFGRLPLFLHKLLFQTSLVQLVPVRLRRLSLCAGLPAKYEKKLSCLCQCGINYRAFFFLFCQLPASPAQTNRGVHQLSTSYPLIPSCILSSFVGPRPFTWERRLQFIAAAVAEHLRWLWCDMRRLRNSGASGPSWPGAHQCCCSFSLCTSFKLLWGSSSLACSATDLLMASDLIWCILNQSSLSWLLLCLISIDFLWSLEQLNTLLQLAGEKERGRLGREKERGRGERVRSSKTLGHLMAVQRLRAESVMYTGSVSVDSDVKAPSDLLLERLLIWGDCKTAAGGKSMFAQ